MTPVVELTEYMIFSRLKSRSLIEPRGPRVLSSNSVHLVQQIQGRGDEVVWSYARYWALQARMSVVAVGRWKSKFISLKLLEVLSVDLSEKGRYHISHRPPHTLNVTRAAR